MKVDAASNRTLLTNYFRNLVNSFFKILPIKETEPETLVTYMESLQVELSGCKSLVPDMATCPQYLSLLSILQYLIDFPECEKREVKREVFKAISLCNKLQALYLTVEE
jgi:hypothetical protein